MTTKKTPTQQLEIAAQWLEEACLAVKDRGLISDLRRVARDCKSFGPSSSVAA